MATIAEGTLLWEPPPALQERSEMRRYLRWLAARGVQCASYEALWQWSVDNIEAFWESIWQFYDVRASAPYARALASRTMPGAQWFPGARLNYAEHILRQATPDRPALIFQSETQPPTLIAWDELARQVAAVAAALRALGVAPGDRVVAYLPNIPQAAVALLACASVGAIWASCSPDFGTASVVDRFAQIAPKVLFAVDGYQYGGKAFDKRAALRELQAALPTLAQTVLIPYLRAEADTAGLDNARLWDDVLATPGALRFEQLPFDHPLWVLYSSGTTGLPKPIVHSQGGILLEHLKATGLHLDLKPGDRFFWFTTTGWMMWNFLLGGLLVGATALLYDGSPGYPTLDVLWEFAERAEMTYFGTSAAYLTACLKADLAPGAQHDLSRLRALGSTGSPLPPEGFAWVYERVKADVWLASVSGGSDVCTAFVGGCPLLPVRAGEIQCRCLGAQVAAFDADGRAVVGALGELVLTAPMPSMPVAFWNDPDGARLRASYFETFPGVWRHGDWAKLTERGSLVIYGRSDSTINRQGVRMGTSELYRAVEGVPEVADSLVIDLEALGREPFLALFVVLQPGVALDEPLQAAIKAQIRRALTPRHVPDAIIAIAEVPRTLNGKKLEVPVKRILLGIPLAQAVNPGSVANPGALQFFVEYVVKEGSGVRGQGVGGK